VAVFALEHGKAPKYNADWKHFQSALFHFNCWISTGASHTSASALSSTSTSSMTYTALAITAS
jgi:hypothetical protein